MAAAFKILVVLLLCISSTKGSTEPQLRFLDRLVKYLSNREDPIETIITVQHSQDQNCSLQHWNPRDIPIIRSNELTTFKVRGTFSSQVMAMVCMGGDSDSILLHVMAKVYENLRHERIMLWTEREPTGEFLADISKQSVKLRFFQVIVVAKGNYPSGVLSYHRLHAYPSPRFIKVKNISNTMDLNFPAPEFTYEGMQAIVKIVGDPDSTIPMKTPTGSFPTTRVEDLEIIEFARRYNLVLKFYDANASEMDHFDIEINPRFITQGDLSAHTDFVNPSGTNSLIVVVPCSNKQNVVDFLRKLGVLSWVWYLLPVYVTFVLVETFVIAVTYRMSGQPYRLTNLNALLNLRAFRAILGLPFPESRRASLSLRQLSLAITLFGFVFSNFFSCKLSALLTKPVTHPEITNFEELRASGLTTLTVKDVRSFIESEIDPQFFNQVIPKFMILKSVDRLRMFLSMNDSFSYIIFSRNFEYFQEFQRSVGKMAFCTSKDLNIAQNMPRMYVFESNSIFKLFLSRFVMYIQEAGVAEHWNKGVHRFLIKAFNVTLQRKAETGPVPLSLQHLQWLGYLLAVGYGIATVVFFVEISLNRHRAIGRGEQPV